MPDIGHFSVFLKCIEIQGFKSFADRLRLELGQGMSVIVGPNGSGKSNVADAVRWVLGEQSAKSLRGTKMEDVIFAGSTKRRPVGMAEVSLIFDNSTGIFSLDFQEVTITRRVYRDGEGQYFINKAQCRLKDIQELFMDTGAGKEGFSIIGQGRVEEILTLKSDERRALIEEASGITKFRARKREAVKRLEGTDQNLDRLADILVEIEGQLEPLAHQAEIAKQSVQLTKEQENTEIKLVVGTLTDVKLKLKNSAENLEALKERFAATAAQLGEKESLGVEKKLKLQALEESIQSGQGAVYQGEQEGQSLKHELELRKERSSYLSEQMATQQGELLELKHKHQKSEERIDALKSKEAVLSKTIVAVQAEVEEQGRQLALMRSDAGSEELERLKSELFTTLSEQTRFSNELTGINHTKGNLEFREGQLLAGQKQKNSEHGELRKTAETLGQEESGLAAEEQRCREQQAAQNQKLAQLKKDWEELSLLQGELVRQTDRWKARLQVLKSMEDSLEGYQRGVREVLVGKKKGQGDCSGICGTVADLLSVDKDYEIAVETALGGSLQNVITSTMADAKRSIAYLKSRQLGRATFLPLDEIQGSRLVLRQEIKNDSSFKGLAVDLVHYEPKYRPAMEFLLGRIVVAGDMEGATRIARMSGYKMRVVTLDGDQVNTGGSLSGGSIQRRGDNLLGRSREMDELKAHLDQSSKEAETLKVKQQALAVLQDELKAGRVELEKQANSLIDQRTRIKVNLENIQDQIIRLDKDLTVLDLQLADLHAEAKDIDMRQIQVTEKVKGLEKAVLDLRQALEEKEKQIKDSAGEADSIGEELTKAKVRLATLEQEEEQARHSLQEEKRLKQEICQGINQREQQVAELTAAQQGLSEEQVNLRSQLETQEAGLLVKQQEVAQLRMEKESLSLSLAEEEESLKIQQRQVEGIKEKIHQEEINQARWETEWENGEKRLNEEFTLTWDEAADFQVQESRSVLMKALQELKHQIEALGPVNHAAIDEYPKTLERYDFLCTQRDDLIEARAKLYELIEDLDQTMSERFKEGFMAVDQAFKQVFVELFNGGYAELRLDNPEDLLETGVEIIAQPPGKKPQYLSLLSGGERALTAIALLFALLRVKPSPFCILDEIEASLDDANVKRFAEYVRKLSGSTQFLVISHRKGTMEAADTLHGITMEESGVSKLLTVQLEEKESASA